MKFSTKQIASVATKRSFGDFENLDELQAILSFMTQDTSYTSSIPRGLNECQPHIIRQFPWLARINKTYAQAEMTIEELCLIIDVLSCLFGDSHEVEPIPRDDHDYKDPIDELKEMGAKNIISLPGETED